jgi:DnaJ like chaperone protein
MSDENSSAACSCCGCILFLILLPVIIILLRYALVIGLVAAGIGVIIFIALLAFGTIGLILDKLGIIKLETNNSQNTYTSNNSNPASNEFFQNLFLALGGLAKADGTVSNSEIKMFKDLIQNLGLTEREKQIAEAKFKIGYQSTTSGKIYIDKLAKSASGDYSLMQMALSVLCLMAISDGVFTEHEKEIIEYAELKFGLSGFAEAFFQNSGHNQYRNSERKQNSSYSRKTDSNTLKTYYAILECSPSASNEEIKKAYRKKSMEFHPDKIASKGLPDAFKKFAEDEQKKINRAYQEIKKSRNF